MFGIGGLFWLQGKAEVEAAALPPPVMPTKPLDELPIADADDLARLNGPALPEASELMREQQRFFRYDRDRNWRVSHT
jgi:hypothetical protein